MIEIFLKALCGQVWKLRTPAGLILSGGPSPVLRVLSPETQFLMVKAGEKSLHTSGRKRGKSSYFEIHAKYSVLLYKACPQEDYITILPYPNLLGFYWSLTDLGEGQCPTPAPSSHSIPCKRGKTEKHW